MDVVFTVANGTVTSVKNSVANINPDNYTIVGNEISLKASYLKTLTNGDKTITFITNNNQCVVKLVVAD